VGGRASRVKGHGWEREVANLLRERLGIDAKRGLAQPRGGSAEEPDVLAPGVPIWLECKRGKKTNARAALAQAVEAIGRSGARAHPVAVCRDDHAEPVVMLHLDVWLEMLTAWVATAPASPQARPAAKSPRRKLPKPRVTTIPTPPAEPPAAPPQERRGRARTVAGTRLVSAPRATPAAPAAGASCISPSAPPPVGRGGSRRRA
jgi:hypothetical protein